MQLTVKVQVLIEVIEIYSRQVIVFVAAAHEHRNPEKEAFQDVERIVNH